MSSYDIRPEGTITRYIAERGFGFITADNRVDDVFFHISEFEDTTYLPTPGDRVCFELSQRRAGRFAAVRITVAPPPRARSAVQRARPEAHR